ncbi:hypothetical protein ACO34A_13990 [Rhizobium sp. ACO-34A]|nr:hypothetical protein ACO34A_13990 [Rhizobium sp. ACO-34A]
MAAQARKPVLLTGIRDMDHGTEWASFRRHHDPVHSMNRRGSRQGNAATKRSFDFSKRVRICRCVHRSRDVAREDVSGYIGVFCNPQRGPVGNGLLSQVEFVNSNKSKAGLALTMTFADVAKIVFEAATDGKPQLRYFVGDTRNGWLKARNELGESGYISFMRKKFA